MVFVAPPYPVLRPISLGVGTATKEHVGNTIWYLYSRSPHQHAVPGTATQVTYSIYPIPRHGFDVRNEGAPVFSLFLRGGNTVTN